MSRPTMTTDKLTKDLSKESERAKALQHSLYSMLNYLNGRVYSEVQTSNSTDILYEMIQKARYNRDYITYEATFVNTYRVSGVVTWYDNSGNPVDTFHAVSGAGKQKYYSIPEGEWWASKLNTASHPKFSRYGVSFRIHLGEDRYDPRRIGPGGKPGRYTSAIRIHPASSSGTEGCIGLVCTKERQLKFFGLYKDYTERYDEEGSEPMRVNVILHPMVSPSRKKR